MRLDGFGRTLVTASNERAFLGLVSDHSRDSHNIIYMITHGNEQIEKPGPIVSLDSSRVYSKTYNLLPPISISICMVPLLLNVLRLRIIRAR